MRFLPALLFLICFCYTVVAQDFLPGSTDVVGYGYDPKKLLNLNCPVFGFSTEKGINFQGRLVPDQMSASVYTTTTQKASETITRVFSDVLKEFTKKTTMSAGITYAGATLALNYNKELATMNHKVSEGNKYLAYSEYAVSYYKLATLAPFALRPDDAFIGYASSLPDHFNPSDPENLDMFQSFVEQCGTEYVQSASFGGYAHMYTTLDQNYVDSQSKSYVSTQIGLSFKYNLFELTAGQTKNKSEIVIDQNFLKNAETNIFFKGGDPQFQSNSTLNEWVKSVPVAAAPLNMTVQPIHGISGIPSAQKAALKAFREWYLSQA